MEDLKKIGSYDVIKVLGEGGFGKVFLVKKDGVEYALKVFIRKGLKYMEHEYNISNKVSPIKSPSSSSMCPDSIACSVDKGDFIFDKTTYYYLVMEFVKGFELTEYIDKIKLNNKKISEKCLIKFTYHILKGIDYLHSHGVAHNDIKPDNIIFNKSQLKLIDLGFSCIMDSSINSQNPSINSLLCSNFQFSGTVFYVSPELYSLYNKKISYNKEIFTKNDIWCFGMTISEVCDYEYYSNQLGERVYQYQYEKGKFPYIPEPKKGKKIPLLLKNLIKECLNFDYKKRPTAKNLMKKLEKKYPFLK